MSDIPRSTPPQPASLSSVGTRMAQIGFDQLAAVLALQAKRIERDRAATQHLCDAWVHARTCDAGAIAHGWQTMMSEYLAANVALWEQGLVSAAKNQAAYGTLLRDTVFNAENARLRAAPAQMTRQVGTVPQAADWMKYLAPFMGMRPDGEAQPATVPHRATSADA